MMREKHIIKYGPSSGKFLYEGCPKPEPKAVDTGRHSDSWASRQEKKRGRILGMGREWSGQPKLLPEGNTGSEFQEIKIHSRGWAGYSEVRVHALLVADPH